MASIVTLIEQIKLRPAMYLGRKSIFCLRAFLDGWCFREPQGVEDIAVMEEFQRWLQTRFHHPSHSWERIIQFYSGDEADATDRFFKLFESFRTPPPKDPDEID